MAIRTAINNFLGIVTSQEGDEASRIRKLVKSLDELALLSNDVSHNIDERDYPEPPEKDYKASYESIGNLFPSLGYYSSALDVLDVEEAAPGAGDAIDDISDIAGDLREIIWRYENTSEDDALFHFELTFSSHWGRHLRSLQLYLHEFCGRHEM